MWWVIGVFLVAVFALLFYHWVRRVPHGYVQFRAGLVLKFAPPIDSVDLIKLRKSLDKFAKKKNARLNLPVDLVKDVTIPTRYATIKGRLYKQDGASWDRMIVYFHGGGWCVCSVETHDEITRRLAITTTLPVLSVDYSLSPEHKFPRALEESIDAVNWARSNSEFESPAMILMGDSAGGNLAINVAQYYTKSLEDTQIKHVVAIYPPVDGSGAARSSKEDFGSGYYLTQKAMGAFSRAYLNNPDELMDPRVSPFLYDDLSHFPNTLILTAEFDPLRDEAEAFADKLREHQCEVKSKRYEGTIHGFFGLKDFGKQGPQAIDDVAEYLRQ
jgi:acetyl esterase